MFVWASGRIDQQSCEIDPFVQVLESGLESHVSGGEDGVGEVVGDDGLPHVLFVPLDQHYDAVALADEPGELEFVPKLVELQLSSKVNLPSSNEPS